MKHLFFDLRTTKALSFERNMHGHIVLAFQGLDRNGSEEIERPTATGVRVSKWAQSCLLSTSCYGYDKYHRLVDGKWYMIALMPTREIERDSDRTTDALCKRGIEKYGYEQPLAGIVPCVLKVVAKKQMKEMWLRYVVAPHRPIVAPDSPMRRGSAGQPCVLVADRSGGGRWVLRAEWDHSHKRWADNGAFAFPVPPS